MTDTTRAENEIAAKMRRAAKMPTPPVQWCFEAAMEIEKLERRVEALSSPSPQVQEGRDPKTIEACAKIADRHKATGDAMSAGGYREQGGGASAAAPCIAHAIPP